MNGFFLVDKKADWTSRDVVTKISHIFHEKKVGHSGTLDPFATGLLVVSMGKATKTSICLDGLDKEYVATLKLGGRTISGDLTNEIVETKEVKPFTKEEILKVLQPYIKQKSKENQVPKYNLTKVISLSNNPQELKEKITNNYRLINGNNNYLEKQLRMLKISEEEFKQKYGN